MSKKTQSKKRTPVAPRSTTLFLRWLGNRTALAKSCEQAAAKRGDYAAALRFEHEHNALIPVLDKARLELAIKNQRPPGGSRVSQGNECQGNDRPGRK